jgi:acetylornithine deacetylase
MVRLDERLFSSPACSLPFAVFSTPEVAVNRQRQTVNPAHKCYPASMDPVSLTRRLVDIESITGNEGALGDFLLRELDALGFETQKMPAPFPPEIEARGRERFNVYACVRGQRPEVVFSTHMDTVPPHIPSSENAERIYGRGSCDAKGIMAAQIAAAVCLREEGVRVGMLYVAGEERDSLGATTANCHSPKPKFLINGEPTENRLALASKGSLRVQLTATGRMAHSAYPELGESAIDKLLTALQRLRDMPLPVHPEAGPTTVNIGVIEGGRAPNVISDFARAQLQYRLIGPSEDLRREIQQAVNALAHAEFVLEIPYVKLRTVPGIPTMVAKFTTDIPNLSNWGEPLLLGPGSIHVAHTDGEYIEKKQLLEAVELYQQLAKKLLG